LDAGTAAGDRELVERCRAGDESAFDDLVLRHVEDLSYEQIAGVLNCSVGTVKSRLARARGRMRQAMEEL
jgi:RNA polymerase sigma factor (sigma-70 family)